MPERDELDRLIDSELDRYGEPRAGLEQRILARVAAETPSQSWLLRGSQRWAITGMVAVAILLVAGIQRITHHETEVSTGNVISPVQSPVASAKGTGSKTSIQVPRTHRGGEAHTLTHRPIARDVAERVPQPKLDVFPAPLPLSAQEQALVALSTSASDVARETYEASRRQMEAPLQISAIEIPPINAPEQGNK